MTKFSRILITLATLLALAPPALAAPVRLALKPQATVNAADITLSDVAYILGPETALKRDLGQIFITRAPEPGRSITIRAGYVENRVKTSGLPLDMLDIRLEGQVECLRDYQEISEEHITRLYRDYLAQTPPYQGADWELARLSVGRLPRMPAGRLEISLEAQPGANAETLTLTFTLAAGDYERKVRAAGRIEFYTQALVAARLIPRDAVVGAADVKKGRVRLDQTLNGAFRRTEQVLGLTARRTIALGEPLCPTDLIKPELVSRGDVVTIIAENGQIMVSAPGQAKQSGAAGDQILVINMISKRPVQATVTEAGEVRVEF